MTKSKPVRGLLDYISLKPGEKPELEPISESYVPGMGLGASKRRNTLGLQRLFSGKIPASGKNHRPNKSSNEAEYQDWPTQKNTGASC